MDDNKYGPKENTPLTVMIPVSSIWKWLKKKSKKRYELKRKNRRSK